MMLNKNDFIIDWLSGVIPSDAVQSVCETIAKFYFAKLDNFEVGTWAGLRNYNTKLNLFGKNHCLLGYNSEVDNVVYKNYDLSVASTEENRIFYGVERYSRFWCGNNLLSGTALINSNNPYIYISVSGQGLAELRSNGTFADFISYLWSLGFCPSRVDVAYNIYDAKDVCYNSVKNSFSNPSFRPSSSLLYFRSSSSTDSRVTYRNVFDDEFYFNYVFGCHSKNMMRLYNKKVEQTQKGFSVAKDFWYRLEFELHSSSARLLWDDFIYSRSIPALFCDSMKKVYLPIVCDKMRRCDCSLVAGLDDFFKFCYSVDDLCFTSHSVTFTKTVKTINYFLNMGSVCVDSIALLLDKLNIQYYERDYFRDLVNEYRLHGKYNNLPSDFADSFCMFLVDYAESHNINGRSFCSQLDF